MFQGFYWITTNYGPAPEIEMMGEMNFDFWVGSKSFLTLPNCICSKTDFLHQFSLINAL